jgi:hypothetical protein
MPCALCAVFVLAALSPVYAADINVPGDYATIQAAIDAATSGDAIYVAAGTYREQLKIDAKSLDLIGAGMGSSIIEAVDLVDRTTYGITQWNGSSRTIDPIVGVVGPCAAGPCIVNISGFTVDGRELGPNEFYGIHFFDASGSVTECSVEDVLYAAQPGAQGVVSIAVTHSADRGVYPTDFIGASNSIASFQKVGLLVMGPECTCVLEDNTITNAPTPYNAGNGIQISYGAKGTTARNDVSGVAYTGDDWGATGILLFESGDVSMTDDVIHECEMGVNYSDWHMVYTNTAPVKISLSGVTFKENEWGYVAHLAEDDCDLNLTMTDCGFYDNTVDGMDLWGSDVDPWGGGYYTGWNNGDLIVDIEGCSFLNTTGYDGIWAGDDSGNSNNLDCTIGTSAFSGNNEAAIWNDFTQTIEAADCYWGDPSGPTVTRGTTDTRPAAPPATPFGGELPQAGFARETASCATRAGDALHGPVNYEPFLTGSIVCVPDPEYLSAGFPTKTIEVKYLGGGSAPLYGYSIKFAWDGSIVSTSTAQVTEGAILKDLGTTFFWKQPGSNEITIDSALLGALDGAVGPGTLFTVVFTAVDLGTSPVNISILDVRDKDNAPITGITEDDGLFVVDISIPTITSVEILNTTLTHTNDYIKDTDAATIEAYVFDDDPAFAAGNIWADLDGLGAGSPVTAGSYNPGTGLATWTIPFGTVDCDPADGTVTVTVDATDPIGNPAVQGSGIITSDNIAPTPIVNFAAAPDHNEAALSWDDPTLTDDNFYQVEIQSNAWGDYPTYTGGPSYPTGQDDGTDVWEGPGNGYTVVYAADGTERDIHYYQAFASDWVLHFGPADLGARDRCTNYWLGDVAQAMGVWGSVPGTPFNGLVNDADIDKLGGTYFEGTPTLSWPDNQCDVGPTHDYSRVGIPEPDDFVGFEDLMVFAMNYGVVSPRIVPFLDTPDYAEPLAVVLDERSLDASGELSVALELHGNTSEVKGLSTVIAFDRSELEFVGARLSSDMNSPLAPVFFWSEEVEAGVQIDLAVLGTDVTIGGSGELATLTFRKLGDDCTLGFENAELRGAENGSVSAVLVGLDSKPGDPVAYRLLENMPNPFNPKTSIRYHVPHESDVSIRIYDVAGREVRVLTEGVTQAGRHEAVWDGRDDFGQAVGSGVYFCVMEAEAFRGSQKMLLLK